MGDCGSGWLESGHPRMRQSSSHAMLGNPSCLIIDIMLQQYKAGSPNHLVILKNAHIHSSSSLVVRSYLANALKSPCLYNDKDSGESIFEQ